MSEGLAIILLGAIGVVFALTMIYRKRVAGSSENRALITNPEIRTGVKWRVWIYKAFSILALIAISITFGRLRHQTLR